jgi:hypothetical protein
MPPETELLAIIVMGVAKLPKTLSILMFNSNYKPGQYYMEKTL